MVQKRLIFFMFTVKMKNYNTLQICGHFLCLFGTVKLKYKIFIEKWYCISSFLVPVLLLNLVESLNF